MRITRLVLRGLAAGWLLLVLLACCTSREVLQSGIVPFSEPLAPPTSHGSADVYAGASGLTYLEPSDDVADLGHYVPASQLHVEGSLRPIGGLTIRPVGLLALAQGASPLSPGLLPPPSAPSFGVGVDIGYTFGDEDEPFLARVHAGGIATAIAMHVQDPAGGNTISDFGWMGVAEGGIDLGYWVTPSILVLGSVDARNGPEVPRSVTACFGDDPPFVGFGGLTINARVGAEVEVAPGLGIVATVGFPVYGSPYTSYPILSLGFRATFGDGRMGFRRSRAPEPDSTPADEAAAEARARPRAHDELSAPAGSRWMPEGIGS